MNEEGMRTLEREWERERAVNDAAAEATGWGMRDSEPLIRESPSELQEIRNTAYGACERIVMSVLGAATYFALGIKRVS